MKKLYFKNIYANKKSTKLMLFVILLIATTFNSYSQVQVDFAPRTSAYTPQKTIYNIKGDFTMMGNTNLQLADFTYPTNQDNGNNMEYVDVDGSAVPGNDTWNSSTATLTFSNENGAEPECSNIIYAGLYWTGRADDGNVDDNDDGDNNPNTFTVTKQVPTGNFTTQQVTDTNISVYNNNNINNTNYSLDISGNPVIFLFTSSGTGDSVRFRWNSNTSISVARNNGSGWGSYTNVSGNYNNKYFYLNTPYEIFSDSNYTLNVTRLRTDGTDRVYVDVTYNETVAEMTTVTKNFDKRVLSIKGPQSSNYSLISAESPGNIFYPSGEYGNMFSGYAEITDYVKANGLGEYYIADIALREGDGGSTGYYGGWGMVVVYENSKMKWRDVTVFDGHLVNTSQHRRLN